MKRLIEIAFAGVVAAFIVFILTMIAESIK